MRIALWWLTLLLVMAAAAEAKKPETGEGPKTVAQLLEQAAQCVESRARCPEAITICEGVIANPSAEPKDKAAAFETLIAALRRIEKLDDALKAAERMQQTLAKDKAAEQRAVLLAADLCRQTRKAADGVARLKDLLGRRSDDKAASAEIELKMAQLLFDAGQFAEARAEAAKAAELDSGNEKLVTDALACKVEASWRLSEIESCLPDLKRLVAPSSPATQRDIAQLREWRSRYGIALRRLQKFDEAVAFYADCEKGEVERKDAPSADASSWCLLAADALAEQGKYDQGVAALERVFTAYPQAVESWYAAQRRQVDLLARKGDFEGALKAAHVCLDAAPTDPAMVDVVRTAAELFRSVDKNLGRANLFINFQRFGPAGNRQEGVPGPLTNPLEEIGYPEYPEREKAFAEARKTAGDDAKAMRYRALTHLYTGHPKEALRCFMDAFSRCAAEEIPQAAHDMILIGARAVRGHSVGLEAFYQFVNYGPAGPDGKLGTADDLPDPFLPLLK